MWKLCCFVLYNCIAILPSYCLCCFRTLFKVSPNLNFFWMFLKGIVHYLLKQETSKCNNVVIRKSCAYNLLSSCQTRFLKMGNVFQRWFLCKLIWFIQCRFFYWDFTFMSKTMQNLKASWIISSISFNFIVWLSCMD